MWEILYFFVEGQYPPFFPTPKHTPPRLTLPTIFIIATLLQLTYMGW